MQRIGDEWAFAPTDLSDHVSCAHLTSLNVAVAEGALERAFDPDLLLEILAERGQVHEAAFVAHLQASGRHVHSASDEATTIALMAAGVEVIYQAHLRSGRWRGRADFLIREELKRAPAP